MINGLIIDEVTSLGIPFATVALKGSGEGTTSDIEGQFNIKAEAYDTLIIRMVGYIKQEVPVSDKNYLEIILKNMKNK